MNHENFYQKFRGTSTVFLRIQNMGRGYETFLLSSRSSQKSASSYFRYFLTSQAAHTLPSHILLVVVNRLNGMLYGKNHE